MDIKQAGRLSVTPVDEGVLVALWGRDDQEINPLAYRRLTNAEAEYLIRQLQETLQH